MNHRSLRFKLTVWYAGLLIVVVVTSGSLVYFGLREYLEADIQSGLHRRGAILGATLLEDMHKTGESYVLEKIRVGYAPEFNNRFLRITRSNGAIFYASGRPASGEFNPWKITRPDLLANKMIERTEPIEYGHYLILIAVPFQSSSGERFIIECGTPSTSIDEHLGSLLFGFSLGLPILVIVAIGGGYLLVGRALKPVDDIGRVADRITFYNLDERLPLSGAGDELERLSIVLNHMIDRLEKSFHHTSQFSANAAHELRTPITVMRCELESLLQEEKLTDLSSARVVSILDRVDHLTKIIEGLLAIARLEAGEAQLERERLDLSELVASTIGEMGLLAHERNISIKNESLGMVEIIGDRFRLKQVIVNLIDNAIKYSPSGGTVQYSVLKNAESACFRVINQGKSIPKEALPHVFNRFFRADKGSEGQNVGAGLGLAIVRSICEAHGGKVEVSSSSPEGTCFTVELPLAESAIFQFASMRNPVASESCWNS